MSWNYDHLAPVETMLFRSDLVKVGHFACAADHPCFPVSESLDNDVFVMLGRPLWIRRNDDDYQFVEPGAVLLHRAGSTLERRHVSHFGERTYWFGVHPDVFVDALQRHKLSTEEMGGALIADLHIRYRLAMLLKQLKLFQTDRLAVEERVLTLFFEICDRRSSQVRKGSGARCDTAVRRRRLVDRARLYLDAHLAEAVSLETVAHAAGTSLYHLCRVFREQTGLTMHAYRIRQRLGRVMDRLIDGEESDLAHIALDLGFSSHSHLCRVFQNQMGVPPSAIRAGQ